MIFPLSLSRWAAPWLIRYEKLPLEEREEQSPSTGSPKGSWRAFTWRYVVVFLLGAGLSSTIAASWLIQNMPHERARQFPTVIPQSVFTPKIPTSWVPDERYIGFSNFSNTMWHHLVKTTESVWISDPDKHGLGAGFEAQFDHAPKSRAQSRFYHISNLHQLHCLNVIRGRYFELQLDLPSLSKQSETAAKDTAYHMDHCIEYLRMTIMCGGSWDVESNSPPGTPSELKTDPFGHPIGWGGVRICVNWNALMSWQRAQMEAYKRLG